MSTALVTLSDMDRMADAIAKSGLFGMKTKEQALALMIVAQAENRHPGSVAAEYHIIQGRPALKADAMLARFQQAGGVVEWQDYTPEKVSALFSHSVNSPKPVLIAWTFEDAKKAGLTGKDNWKNYPRQMLRARVISEGVRTVYPAVSVGVYTPEEVQDFEPADGPRRGRPRKEKDITDDAEIVGDERAAGSATSSNPTGATPPRSSSDRVAPPEGTAAGAPSETRAQSMKRLCDAADMAMADLLAKAEVAHPDEMTDADWASLTAMLNRRIKKLETAAQA